MFQKIKEHIQQLDKRGGGQAYQFMNIHIFIWVFNNGWLYVVKKGGSKSNTNYKRKPKIFEKLSLYQTERKQHICQKTLQNGRHKRMNYILNSRSLKIHSLMTTLLC